MTMINHNYNDRDDDNDYDDCNAPNTTRADETFKTLNSMDKQTTSTLPLRQKLKRDRLATLYRLNCNS